MPKKKFPALQQLAVNQSNRLTHPQYLCTDCLSRLKCFFLKICVIAASFSHRYKPICHFCRIPEGGVNIRENIENENPGQRLGVLTTQTFCRKETHSKEQIGKM